VRGMPSDSTTWNDKVRCNMQPATTRFRWQIVPAFLCGFFAVILVFGSIVNGAGLLYVSVRYGPMTIDPGVFARDDLLRHLRWIIGIRMGIAGGVAGGFASRAWLRSSRRRAAGLTVLLWILGALATTLCSGLV
jgi:hypothetical protein